MTKSGIRKENLTIRIKEALRGRIWSTLKGNYEDRGGSAKKLLGCSIYQFKQHLESKFQPGMTWENWSQEGWHIDHIIPLSSFDLTDPEQCKIAFHYSNQQPLWAFENRSKGCKLV